MFPSRKLTELRSDVINNMDKYRFKSRWTDVVDATRVENIVLPLCCGKCASHTCGSGVTSSDVKRSGLGSAQYANYDLNKFKEEEWSLAVSDVECVQLAQCIYKSMK